MVTLKDIAKKVNFSESIVSRALNNYPYIKESTRELIIKTAKEMGYYPNIAARSLVTRKTQTIGVFMASITGMYYASIIKGLEYMADKTDYTLIFSNSYKRPGYQQFLAKERVDGLIVFSSYIKERNQILKLIAQDIPIVVVECYLSDPRANCIWVENVYGGYIATKHLLEIGHTRVAHIAGDLEYQVSFDRLEGYKKALTESNISIQPELITTGNYTCEDGYEAMKSLLEYRPRCTGVFIANDAMAYGALQAINEAGLSVPQDISVVGYDDIDFSALTHPPLTTIRQPLFKLGEKSMSVLVSILKNKQKKDEGSKICLMPELVLRKSTGPLDGNPADPKIDSEKPREAKLSST
jgi:LacI family transcriptional regulator